MRNWRWMCDVSVVAVVAVLCGAAGTRAQAPRPAPLLTESLVGRDLFVAYCAACHGREGRGDGPVSPALRVQPADLTSLARRNGGAYPAARVQGRLTGAAGPDESGAHGSTAMPIWGPIFRQLGDDAVNARVRVENLVSYIRSIQLP